MAAILRGGLVGPGESSAGFIAVICIFDGTSLPKSRISLHRRKP
jgi:hypothetical protein